ncbi:MAG TPA: hypothetical protein VFP93_02185 [Gammaproteobacteria bacterium]|nr:hypothetical protein [Gammaproteobacteria bacterium]
MRLIFFKSVKWIQLAFLGTAISFQIFAAEQSSENLYKYQDENGIEIISTSLPGEAANRGYTVISPRGNVIEVVPPKPSDEEVAKSLKEEQKKVEFEKQKEEELHKKELEAKKDIMLLKMFGNVQDIERSRDEKLSSIKVQEDITKDNLERIKLQLQKAQEISKIHQDRNQPVPPQIEETIKDSQFQIEENTKFLIRKTTEKKQIHDQYEKLIERFNEIKVQDSSSVE